MKDQRCTIRSTVRLRRDGKRNGEDQHKENAQLLGVSHTGGTRICTRVPCSCHGIKNKIRRKKTLAAYEILHPPKYCRHKESPSRLACTTLRKKKRKVRWINKNTITTDDSLNGLLWIWLVKQLSAKCYSELPKISLKIAVNAIVLPITIADDW